MKSKLSAALAAEACLLAVSSRQMIAAIALAALALVAAMGTARSDTSIPIPEWEVHGPWPTMPWWEDYEYYDQTNPKRQSPWLNNTQVYPKGMALKMEPADLWAIANLRFKELPPVEFDRPV